MRVERRLDQFDFRKNIQAQERQYFDIDFRRKH